MEFEDIESVCKFGHFSIDGWVCGNRNNITFTKGVSWGTCSKGDCPVITHKVEGRIYANGKQIGTFSSIKY